jgi:UDP-N-acetylmuramoylalanine--D-glutamate ligase
MKYKDFFKNKKVTLMGLGLLGRGIGDASFIAKYSRELVITDLKTENDLKQSINKLKKYKNIKFTLGNHSLDDFRDRDMIIKGAGVPLDSPFIKEAKKNSIPVYMSTALFAKFWKEDFNGKVIGVTGTRGKTTTTNLIYHILKQYGFNCILGGNIQGVSTLKLLDKKNKKGGVAVLELDSWQLQGFGDLKISPDISVFTNLYRDHMNYYKNDMLRYFDDKAQIFIHQNNQNILVCGENIHKDIIKRYKNKLKQKVIKTSSKKIPHSIKHNLLGNHNLENLSCAIAVAREFGISEEKINKSLKNFKNASGRLELVKKFKGVEIYNDTTSTTPEAGLSALRSFENKRGEIILICGGSDKSLNMDTFVNYAKKVCKEIILLKGTGTDKIKLKLKNKLVFDRLEDALKLALRVSKKGDIILFSPSFASFGMFKNEYDRGDNFNRILNKLTKN